MKPFNCNMDKCSPIHKLDSQYRRYSCDVSNFKYQSYLNSNLPQENDGHDYSNINNDKLRSISVVTPPVCKTPSSCIRRHHNKRQPQQYAAADRVSLPCTRATSRDQKYHVIDSLKLYEGKINEENYTATYKPTHLFDSMHTQQRASPSQRPFSWCVDASFKMTDHFNKGDFIPFDYCNNNCDSQTKCLDQFVSGRLNALISESGENISESSVYKNSLYLHDEMNVYDHIPHSYSVDSGVLNCHTTCHSTCAEMVTTQCLMSSCTLHDNTSCCPLLSTTQLTPTVIHHSKSSSTRISENSCLSQESQSSKITNNNDMTSPHDLQIVDDVNHDLIIECRHHDSTSQNDDNYLTSTSSYDNFLVTPRETCTKCSATNDMSLEINKHSSVDSNRSTVSFIGHDFSTLDLAAIKAHGISVREVHSVYGEGIKQVKGALWSPPLKTVFKHPLQNEEEDDDNFIERCCCPCSIDDLCLNVAQLKQRVQLFNENELGLSISMSEDNQLLHGFIRIHINLIRPIKMKLNARAPSIYDIVISSQNNRISTEITSTDNLTPVSEDFTELASFFLPRGTTKVLQINSNSNTREVISGLLRKFYIRDNPRKFALYEHTIEGVRAVCVRKLLDCECPLLLMLGWLDFVVHEGLMVNQQPGCYSREIRMAKLAEVFERKRLVLQENETGDINWETFTLPELDTFLRILLREEEEHKKAIQLKYKLLQNELSRKMSSALSLQQPEDTQPSAATCQ